MDLYDTLHAGQIGLVLTASLFFFCGDWWLYSHGCGELSNMLRLDTRYRYPHALGGYPSHT